MSKELPLPDEIPLGNLPTIGAESSAGHILLFDEGEEQLFPFFETITVEDLESRHRRVLEQLGPSLWGPYSWSEV